MLKREEYIKTVRRPYPPLFSSLIFLAISNFRSYQGLLSSAYAVKNVIIFDGYWHYAKRELDRASRLVLREWTNKSRLERVKKILRAREKALLRVCRGDFKDFSAAYIKYGAPLILVWWPQEAVEKRMRSLLGQKLGSSQVERLMSILNIPLADNFYKKEEYDLVRAKDLAKHVKEYEWIKSRYGEIHPYTIKEARAKLKKINKQKFLKARRLEKRKVRQVVRQAKRILGRQSCLADLMQYMVYYRTQRTDMMNRAQYLFAPKLLAIAKKNSLTYSQLLHCTADEVLGHLPSRSVIQERMRGQAVIMEEGKIRCVSGRGASKIRVFLREKIKRASEIRGNIAYPGLAQGKARIILDRKDFSRVKKGDILVTSMTSTAMLPIMKKAVAFVTDEGGITCHAAIVSRELKKPCLIGTRIATQVLRDGDRVEVDADKGTVRKVK